MVCTNSKLSEEVPHYYNFSTGTIYTIEKML